MLRLTSTYDRVQTDSSSKWSAIHLFVQRKPANSPFNQGLTCLKKAGVSHRDLSLENLLVEEGNVLVIDMGMCLRIPMIDIDGARRRTLILPQGVCGKWHYMSPGRRTRP